MANLMEKAQELAPVVVLPPGDDEAPVDVDILLRQMRLIQLEDGDASTRLSRGEIDLRDPSVTGRFQALAADPFGGRFLTADLFVDAAPESGSSFSETRFRQVRQDPDRGIVYFTVREDAAELVNQAFAEDLGLGERLRDLSVISYYLYFPRQNGIEFDTYPTEREGHWSGMSILLDRETTEPLLAGFHGLGGVRIVPWDEVDTLFDRPAAYVGLGTHSLFEAEGEYPTRVARLTGLEEADREFLVANVFGLVALGAFVAASATGVAALAGVIAAATAVVAMTTLVFFAAAILVVFAILAIHAYRSLSSALDPAVEEAAYRPVDSTAIASEEADLDEDAWARPFEPDVATAREVVPKNGKETMPSQGFGPGFAWWGTFFAWGEQRVGAATSRPRALPGLLQQSLEHSFMLAAIREL